jgi:hypothetical protein
MDDLFVWFMGVMVGFGLGVLVFTGTTPTYAEGFCAARGGVVITSDYCDVEGRVVAVEW